MSIWNDLCFILYHSFTKTSKHYHHIHNFIIVCRPICYSYYQLYYTTYLYTLLLVLYSYYYCVVVQCLFQGICLYLSPQNNCIYITCTIMRFHISLQRYVNKVSTKSGVSKEGWYMHCYTTKLFMISGVRSRNTIPAKFSAF